MAYEIAADTTVNLLWRLSSGQNWREVRSPGDKLSDLPQGPRQSISVLWTPEVIASWRAKDADTVESTSVPDVASLSDWRIGLVLWGRLDELLAKVALSMEAGQVVGRIANERLEYANTVLRSELMQLRGVFGFSVEDVDESLWRAERVRRGDLTGAGPSSAIP